MAEQMVPFRPDQRIACRSRKMPSRCTRPIVPAELYGHTDWLPWRSAASVKPVAMRSNASSQPIRRNWPLPFGPVRNIGYSSRSGWWMRSA